MYSYELRRLVVDANMRDFVLVDLDAQYDELIVWLAGKSKPEILGWMQQYGNVSQLDNPYDDALYSFRSSANIQTAFRFDESDKIIIFHRRW